MSMQGGLGNADTALPLALDETGGEEQDIREEEYKEEKERKKEEGKDKGRDPKKKWKKEQMRKEKTWNCAKKNRQLLQQTSAAPRSQE